MKNKAAPVERSLDTRMASGQGPEPAVSRPAQLTAAQQVVLEALSEAGRAGIQELSRSTGLHGNTVREHLGALVKAGLVRQQLARPQGRGRPSTVYEAVPPPRMSTELAVALAAELAASTPDPAAAAIRAGRIWAGGSSAKDQSEPLDLAMANLREHGFDPELAPGWQAAPGKSTGPGQKASPGQETAPGQEAVPGAAAKAPGLTEIRLRRCPMLEAVKEQPEIVCNVHLGLIRGWLEDRPDVHADLEPFAGQGYCAVHLAGADGNNGVAGTHGRHDTQAGHRRR